MRSPASPEVYEQLDRATPEDRAAIVLRLIEDNPYGRLELPQRQGVGANLYGLDLSPETTKARYGRRLRTNPPSWWDRDFQCVRLVRADLQGANLFHAKLSHVHLQYADLREARLCMADLSEALLLGTDLAGASLMTANLRGASLIGATLVGAGLRDCDLRHANLEYADLRGVNAWKTNFEGAYLRDASLQGVTLTNADLSHVRIGGAYLGETRLGERQFSGAIGEELDGDFNWARLGYQSLRRNFMGIGDTAGADWAYRRERLMLRMQARAQRQWGRLLTVQAADALRDVSVRFSGAIHTLIGRGGEGYGHREESRQPSATEVRAQAGLLQRSDQHPDR
ncbi:MAG: pentapeptide repeat-containing protein [Anaerolineae bacterium]